jgi:CubicO group peptidase (beta-lactamase class C family)
MVNDGLVKLDDPLQKYLPSNVTIPKYSIQNMTLENLATHTAGLPEFPDNFCKDYWNNFDLNHTTEYRMKIIECSQKYLPSELYQGLANTSISTEFGSKFGYSSFGMGLLDNILALKSNMSYDDLLEKKVLSMLGMVNTSITLTEEQKSDLAVGHINGDELPMWNLAPVMTPSGGIYSTANDMLKFVSVNIGLIKTKLDAAMQESHLIRHYNGFLGPNNVQVSDNNSGEGFYVGLGWMINTNYGSEVVWHNGITADGFNSIIAFNPSTHKGIVLLSSADHKDIDIANIGLLHKEGFANLIWNLLY